MKIFPYKMNSASTLQRTILYKKSYSELLKFIESNPAFEVLSVDNEFWQEKALIDFKVPNWYFNLSSEILPPPQNYLYFLTKFALIPESDQILELNGCFARAAQMGDLPLMEIFAKRMEERQIQPNYDKAFVESIRGGHLSIAKSLKERISFYQHYLIFACDSGDIEVFNYVFEMAKNAGWEENLCHISANIILLQSLAISFEFYTQVKNALRCDVSHLSFNFDSIRITKTGSVESYRRISTLITNPEEAENALIGAFISKNSELIEEVSQQVGPGNSLDCVRKACAYLGEVENYSTIVKNSEISDEEILGDVKYALANNSYSVIEWIFNNRDFGEGQLIALCSVIPSATRKGDMGLFKHISKFLNKNTLKYVCTENLRFANESNCIPLIELCSKELRAELTLLHLAAESIGQQS